MPPPTLKVHVILVVPKVVIGNTIVVVPKIVSQQLVVAIGGIGIAAEH